MGKSKIEWTDETWNPVTGCSKVSPGCKHCYAERQWPRLAAPGQPYAGRAFTDVQCHPERLEQPLRWQRPRMVFVNSMSDLFHEDVPDSFLDLVIGIMRSASRHTFQVLTKRPERMRDYMMTRPGLNADSLPNVWLGVSAEDQETWDDRSWYLLNTPAAIRFASLEPLLAPISLNQRFGEYFGGLHWVIVGGESGPKARPMHPDWVRSIRDECVEAGVPFFFKQFGEWAPNCLCDTKYPHRTTPRPEPGKPGVMFRCGKRIAGRTLDGRKWGEYPKEGKT